MGAGISPYPFALFFPQDEHERLLIDCLAELGVHVERCTELVNFKEASGWVEANLKRSDGNLEICSTAYLAGCDGAHSTVREALNIGFPGAHIPTCFMSPMSTRPELSSPPRADLSILILLGRTKVRLKPLLLELHPSSSDELVNRPFSELRFRDETLAPSDSIKSNLQAVRKRKG